MDWVKHKCDNAFMIKGRAESATTALVPYHFEDTLDEKEYKRLQETISPEQLFQMENQHFLVQTMSHDNTLKQQLIAASLKPMDPKLHTVYRRGKKPDDRLDDIPYTIELSGGGIDLVLKGTIKDDSIYKGHLAWLGTEESPGKIMSWLLDRRKESSSVVLFPRVTALPEERAFPTKGTMSIKVTVNGKTVNDITNASYTMRTRGYEWTRAMGKFLTPRLKALFPGKDAAIKDMKMLRLQEGSTSLVLIFNVPRMEAESMRLEGVVYTVSETNLLRAAFGPAVVKSGKPPSVSTPKKAAVAPVVDTPPSPFSTEEDAPLPPPPSNNDDYSEYDLNSPPPSRPNEPSSSPSSLEVNEGELSSFEKSLRDAKLKKTPPPTGPVGGSKSNDLQDTLSKALDAIRRVNVDDSSTSKRDDCKEFDDCEAEISRQILFSPVGIPMTVECDASNLAHVTGLAMALEYRAATGDARVKTADMEHVTSIIQEYARNPHFDATAAEVPLHVSTAIYTALDVLSQ
jgi:hypothetical protein